jgi:hypothetical protein
MAGRNLAYFIFGKEGFKWYHRSIIIKEKTYAQ